MFGVLELQRAGIWGEEQNWGGSQSAIFPGALERRLEQRSEPVFAQVLTFVYGDYFLFCTGPWADTQKGSPRAHPHPRAAPGWAHGEGDGAELDQLLE